MHVVFERTEVQLVSQRSTRLRILEQLLAEIGHLFGGVFLIEPDQVGQGANRRLGTRRKVRGQIRLQLELHHDALRSLVAVEVGPQLGEAGDLHIVDQLSAAFTKHVYGLLENPVGVLAVARKDRAYDADARPFQTGRVDELRVVQA